MVLFEFTNAPTFLCIFGRVFFLRVDTSYCDVAPLSKVTLTSLPAVFRDDILGVLDDNTTCGPVFSIGLGSRSAVAVAGSIDFWRLSFID